MKRITSFALYQWILIVPTLLFTLVLLQLSQRHFSLLPPVVDSSLLFKHFVNDLPSRFPDQVRYLITIGFPCSVFLLSHLFKNSWGTAFGVRAVTGNKRKVTEWLAFCVQVYLFGLTIHIWKLQEKWVNSYIGLEKLLICGYWAYICFTILHAIRNNPKLFRNLKKISEAPFVKRVPDIAVGLITGIQLMGSVFDDTNLYQAVPSVYAHFPFMLGEFSAIFFGKSSWTDFYPQYQSLLSYLAIPFFKTFGLNVFTSSLMLAFFSWMGLVAIYLGIKQWVKNSFIAFLCYLPIVSFGFYSIFHPEIPGNPNAFNYFAIWPARFFWPSLEFLLLSLTLRKNFAFRNTLIFMFATLGVLNNVDFGLCGFIGCISAVVFSSGVRSFAVFKNLKKIIQELGLGLCGGVIFFVLVTTLHSGHFPDLAESFKFLIAFGQFGVGGANLPDFSIQELIYGSYVVCFLLGSYLSFSEKFDPTEVGLLIFTGIFGCGSLFYYITRPHATVLVCFFVPWSLSVVLLLWFCIRNFWESEGSLKWGSVKMFTLLPLLILLWHYFIFVSFIKDFHSPQDEIARFKPTDRMQSEFQDKIFDFLKLNLDAKDSTVSLMMSDANRYTSELKIQNIFPYVELYSIFFKKQWKTLLLSLKEAGVKKVFVRILQFPSHSLEFKEELQKQGFVYQSSIDTGGGFNLEYWRQD